jgi:RHS repeat-associated protein
MGNRFGFQGQLYDPAMSLVDTRARFYRPTWGRFVSPDPIGLAGGPNLFAFVVGAPGRFWDPLGLDGKVHGDFWTTRGAPSFLHTPNGGVLFQTMEKDWNALLTAGDRPLDALSTARLIETAANFPFVAAAGHFENAFARPLSEGFNSLAVNGRDGGISLAEAESAETTDEKIALYLQATSEFATGFDIGAATLSPLATRPAAPPVSIPNAIDQAANGTSRSAAGGVETLSSSDILFSQSSVRGVEEIAASMRASGWVGPAIDVVSIEGRLITVDNTRLLAAHLTGTPVKAVVHGAGEALPASMAGRFVSASGVEATTWGEAVLIRIGNQTAGYRSAYPLGSWVTGGRP